MKVTLIGHSGYVGQNIKLAFSTISLEKLYLIDRITTAEEKLKFISDSDIVVHSAAIQRPQDNVIEGFLPNLDLTKEVVDNLPKFSKLIFVSSIHYNSNTPFGIIRRMEEEYISNRVKNFTIYHLPHTFGPYGKSNYNNVFNTFIISVINNKEILLKDFNQNFPLIPISEFINRMVLNIDKSLNIVDDFDPHYITLPKFLFLLLKIKKGESSNSKIFKELKTVYDWYKTK